MISSCGSMKWVMRFLKNSLILLCFLTRIEQQYKSIESVRKLLAIVSLLVLVLIAIYIFKSVGWMVMAMK